MPPTTSKNRLQNREDRFRQLRKEARDLIVSFGIPNPPVDLDALTPNRSEIVVFEADLRGECDGMLRWGGERQRFYLHYDKDSYKRRFNQAHELAHFFIDEHCHSIRTGMGLHRSIAGTFVGGDFMELEADTFASELLIPRHFYQRSPAEPTMAGVRKIAGEYRVSFQCAARAVALHADVPMSIISSEHGIVRSIYNNELMVEDGANEYLSGSAVPLKSASAQVNVVSPTSAIDLDASVWFDRFTGDPDMREEALFTRFGVVAILVGNPST